MTVTSAKTTNSRFHTFSIRAVDRARRGDTERVTRPTFQEYTRPTIKPPIAMHKYCMVVATLSDIPFFTLSTSL